MGLKIGCIWMNGGHPTITNGLTEFSWVYPINGLIPLMIPHCGFRSQLVSRAHLRWIA